MVSSKKYHQTPPFKDALPEKVFFRAADMPADSEYPIHTHDWGEFVYAYIGVMEVKIGKNSYLAPSQYGLWLPPKIEHQGLNRYEASHCSLYVSAPITEDLPKVPCALEITPLTRSILVHLRSHSISSPYSQTDKRLLQVLVDQLISAKCAGSYLPGSADPILGPILDFIERNPGDAQSLAQLARLSHTTERTVMRRAKRDLGMPLSEWRQRLRTVEAMKRLDSGIKVESIALDLGYASASSFIAMFKKLMGVTPDEYRRGTR
ncbi:MULTISPECIES: helix-turn-helix transcriptional regulator [unclassified Marinobacter]|jgi:AraC-like DNA-binding protein|uniref:AraC family transcriptional regulator n=1 Tax=unclassified Marinobacter TaxID=83889 RepID=UPI00200CE51B|nr:MULTISPECIES: helix-turn-helix transcriptional regulator [unclassified Marinobacter]UQG58013.1 helix-turn-helix transcriptional regulator [Marinobacter sp. M4C]UQG66818.1 helix-turn-helix transcriptional regulator [Marinobacter sp. M2C]UQG71098.1 helix-turn-helix transcriptional regulator [Marinobacter sp. M1C]